MSTSLNLFLVLVLGVYLILALIAHQEMTDLSLVKQTKHLWSFDEAKEGLNVCILIVWHRVSNFLINWTTDLRNSRERPRSSAFNLFGLCALHLLMMCLLCTLCMKFYCQNGRDCLNVIGL